MDGLRFCQLIHKYLYIPCVMSYIGSRTGITRVQNILHNISFISACNEENQLLSIE